MRSVVIFETTDLMQKFFLITCCFLSLGVLLLLAQPPFAADAYRQSFTVAERYFNTADPTDATDSLAMLHYRQTLATLHRLKRDDTLAVICYTRIGILYQARNEETAALRFFDSAIAYKKTRPALADSFIFKPLLFAGASYYSLANYDSALYFFKKADSVAGLYHGLDEEERLYNKMGALAYQTGNYKQSITYFTKTINSLHRDRADYRDLYIQYRINLGTAYYKLQDYAAAMAIDKELLSFNSSRQAEILHNIGILYAETGDYSKAVQTLLPLNYDAQVKQTDLARIGLKIHNIVAAKTNLDSALAINKAVNGKRKNLTAGLTEKYYGDYCIAENNIEAALEHYQRSVIQLDADFSDSSRYANPQHFSGLHSAFNLFNTLNAKAGAFTMLYRMSKRTPELIAALDAYQSAFELAKHVERFLDTDESRLFLKKNADTVYAAAVEVALELYERTGKTGYRETAFLLCERSKASILQLSRQETDISQSPGVPQVLLHEEKNIKATIAALTIQANANRDSAAANGFQQRITDFELKLAKLQDALNANPRYRQLRSAEKPLSVQQLMSETLGPDQALISYYFTGKRLISFVMTNDHFSCRSALPDSNFYRALFRERTTLESAAAYDNTAGINSGRQLFNMLLGPVYDLIKHKKQLIIVPHNELNYLPFEALVLPQSNDYLLQSFAISYNYSASFLTKQHSPAGGKQVLAFAPFSAASPDDHSDNRLAPLPDSKQEIQFLQGKLFFDSAATKGNFLKQAGSFPIIHLATHARADDRDPARSFIAFYPQKTDTLLESRLYEQEISNMELTHTELVLLSACETGKGQLVRGEGLMSLSRAFSYAGCPAVITSLWKAEDKATANITGKLYGYLNKGYPKDIALQKAKLDYLSDDNVAPNLKTPNFWAHLILIGDTSPVYEKRHNFLLIFIGTFSCLLVAFFAIKKRSQRQKNRQA